MINRESIEKVLRLNGIEPGAKDEEIKSVLLSARFDKNEVDAAIMVLRQNINTNQTRVDGLHKVFQTDQTLNPKEISELLGIDVALDSPIRVQNTRHITTMSHVLLFIISVSLAITMLLMFMYFTKVGIFHPTSAVAAKFAR